jgi:hypothetical protein
MIKRALILFFLTSISALSYGQTDTAASLPKDSSTQVLLKLDFEKFLGKEIYLFLLNDTVRQYYDRVDFLSYYRFGFLNGAYLERKIADSSIVGIEIFVPELKYQNVKNLKRDWNKELLLKEIISGIKIIWFRGGVVDAPVLKDVGDTYYLNIKY